MDRNVLELQVGDLVMWTGKETEHSSLKRRLIYQVVSKKLEGTPPHENWRHQLRVAFDFEQPSGTNLQTISWSSWELKKLSLLDLGTLRIHFDTFIKWWAETQGFEDQYERPEDGKYGPAVAKAGGDPDNGTPPT